MPMIYRYYIFYDHRRPFALQTPPTTAPRPSYTGSAISTSTLDSASGLKAESPLHIRLSSRGDSGVTTGEKDVEEGNAHDDGKFLCFMFYVFLLHCFSVVVCYSIGSKPSWLLSSILSIQISILSQVVDFTHNASLPCTDTASDTSNRLNLPQQAFSLLTKQSSQATLKITKASAKVAKVVIDISEKVASNYGEHAISLHVWCMICL